MIVFKPSLLAKCVLALWSCALNCHVTYVLCREALQPTATLQIKGRQRFLSEA